MFRMEPFSSPSTESAGLANLSTIFSNDSAPASPSSSKGSVPSSSSSSSQEKEVAAPSNELGELGKLGEVPDSQSQEASQSEEAPEQEAQEPNWLEVPVTDDKGRRKVKVDLNNKEQLTKTLSMAYGFRKAVAERDNVSSKLKEMEPKYTELKTSWDTLENAYQSGGIEGLVDLLGGKQGYYSEWKRGELDKELRYQNASDSEKRELELREKLDKLEKESSLREKRASEEAKRAQTDREEAQLRNLESQITPSFNKHRFAGQLGDAGKEARLDKAIWDQALQNLEALPDTTELTNAIIEREFKQIATEFRAIIGKQAQVQAKKAIENKKQAAQTQVAAAATRSSARPSTIESSMHQNIRKGGIGGLTNALMDVLRSK